MADVTCPHCENRIRLASPEINTPYACKKCYTTFYLDDDGDVVAGAPPRQKDEEIESLKQQLGQYLERVPVKKVVGGLAALAVVYLLGSFLFGPAPDLEDPAREAAQALADGDVGALRSFAASGTADDVARWYEVVHPLLVQSREAWFGRDEQAEAHVIQVDQGGRRGVAALSIHPAALGSTRDVALADADAVAATPPFDVQTVWTRGRWGGWRLDGRQSLAKVQP